MDIKITSQGQDYTCAECKNETSVENGNGVGDVVECPYCGIEYEILSKDEDGNYELSIIEEEK